VSPCLRKQAANSVVAAVEAGVGSVVTGAAIAAWLVDVGDDPTLATPGAADPLPQAVARAPSKSTATTGTASPHRDRGVRCPDVGDEYLSAAVTGLRSIKTLIFPWP
jgi:hypothetical protein